MREVPPLHVAGAVERPEVEVTGEPEDAADREPPVSGARRPAGPVVPHEEAREEKRQERLHRVGQVVKDSSSLEHASRNAGWCETCRRDCRHRASGIGYSTCTAPGGRRDREGRRGDVRNRCIEESDASTALCRRATSPSETEGVMSVSPRSIVES